MIDQSRSATLTRVRRRASPHELLGPLVVKLILVFTAVISVVPMLWLLIAPSKLKAEFSSLPPFAFGSFENYANAWNNLLEFQDGIVLTWTWNSVWYTALIVLFSTATAVLAGFALAVTALPFKRAIIFTTLIAMLVPPVALVLPLFIEVSALGLYNSPWALILVSSLNPFGVFLAYIHFSTSIPAELFEAARIDGCSEFSLFFRIALPLAGGVAGMIAFFSFTAAWVNYFLPYLVLGSSANYPLPLGLGILFSSTPALNPSIGANTQPVGRPEIALAGLLVAIPILLVFLASSRLLVRGTLSGAVKS